MLLLGLRALTNLFLLKPQNIITLRNIVLKQQQIIIQTIVEVLKHLTVLGYFLNQEF